MRSQIRLGKVFGIDIGLHYSWFLIALLIVSSLSSQFHASNPEWGDGVILTMAIATALLFFVSLLLHELAHSVVATRNGLPVKEITLFALGGVSQIEKNPTERKPRILDGLRRSADQRRHRRNLPPRRPHHRRRVHQPLDGDAPLARIYQLLAGRVQSDSRLSSRRRPRPSRHHLVEDRQCRSFHPARRHVQGRP